MKLSCTIFFFNLSTGGSICFDEEDVEGQDSSHALSHSFPLLSSRGRLVTLFSFTISDIIQAVLDIRRDWFQSISSIFENDANRESMESDVNV